LLLGELYPRENEVIPEARKRLVDDRILKFLYDADLHHVESSVPWKWMMLLKRLGMLPCWKNGKNRWPHIRKSYLN